ncbi:chemotaxis protein CheC [Candidatus Woesearchaeota archaeon]|nr:chemotaxis protein CheC [Candidatus Woesearchaeota archaeon]
MSKKSFLLLVDSSSLDTNYRKLVGELNNKGGNGLVVNFRYPSIKEKEKFQQSGVDVSRLFFIDGISVLADLMPKDSNIYSLINLNDLEGINQGITTMTVKAGKLDFLVIDILDALQFYNSIEKIKGLITKLSQNPFPFFVFTNKENTGLLNQISPLFEVVCFEGTVSVDQLENLESMPKPQTATAPVQEEVTLSRMELDALQEIGNIGSGNASTTLGNVMNTKIALDLTDVALFEPDIFLKEYSQLDNIYVVSVFLRVLGYLPGSIVIMFKREDALKFVDLAQKKALGTMKEIDADSQEILETICIQVTQGYIRAMSDFLDLNLSTAQPLFTTNKRKTIIDFMIHLITASLNNSMLAINTNFNVEEHGIRGEFLLLFGINSLKDLKNLIAKKLGVQS